MAVSRKSNRYVITELWICACRKSQMRRQLPSSASALAQQNDCERASAALGASGCPATAAALRKSIIAITPGRQPLPWQGRRARRLSRCAGTQEASKATIGGKAGAARVRRTADSCSEVMQPCSRRREAAARWQDARRESSMSRDCGQQAMRP